LAAPDPVDEAMGVTLFRAANVLWIFNCCSHLLNNSGTIRWQSYIPASTYKLYTTWVT